MAACLFYFADSEASILFVPDNYTSINSAIQASQFGDTVLARRGVYHETVIAPNWDITIAGEFLLTQDSLDIDSCIIRPTVDTLGRRCIFASSDLLTHRLNLQGLTLRHGGTNAVHGGAIYCENRYVQLVSCKIDSCLALFGGAVYSNRGEADISNCRFYRNAAIVGNLLFVYNGRATLTGCEIAYSSLNSSFYEISGDSSSVFLDGCHIHDLGFQSEGTSILYLHFQGLMDTLQTKNCLIENCRLNLYLNFNNASGVHYFFFDSNYVAQNQITQLFYVALNTDSCIESTFIANIFRNNTRTPNTNGYGLLNLGDPAERTIMTDNTFENNFSGELSCVSVGTGGHERSLYARNIFIGNSNSAFLNPPGGAVSLIATAGTMFYNNMFMDNIGFAAWHGPHSNQSETHGEHNYWGATSGPYDSIGNPAGEGDTVEFRITYSPWEPDTSFENSADEPFIPHPSSFTLSTYPNPYNSSTEIRYELAKQGRVKLSVYDILGREVRELVNKVMSAGEHSVMFEGKELGSGIYFAKMEITPPSSPPVNWRGMESKIVKMVMLK